MNTRQKACRTCCPAKTRRERVECRLADGQCANAQKIQEAMDRNTADKRKQGKIGVSGVGGYGDKG
jgi:hypothetical protein